MHSAYCTFTLFDAQYIAHLIWSSAKAKSCAIVHTCLTKLRQKHARLSLHNIKQNQLQFCTHAAISYWRKLCTSK